MISSHEPPSTFGSRLLGALPRAEYLRLLPRLKLIHLPPKKILYDVGEVVRYAYFPQSGMISLLSSTEDGRTIEVGMIGNEGVAGIAVILRMSFRTAQFLS